MSQMIRYFLMLMVVLTALIYFKGVRELQARAKTLPLSGEDFCRHLPENLRGKCDSQLAGFRFDPMAANFCVSKNAQIDFVCLNEIKNAIFQINMVGLCAGHNPAYMRLCLMALRNKWYSEGEKHYCEREEPSVDRVFCLSRYGRPYG